MGKSPHFLFINIKFNIKSEAILDSKIIIEAFTALAKEKNIEKGELSSIIEEVFMSLIVKKYGEENIDIFSINIFLCFIL